MEEDWTHVSAQACICTHTHSFSLSHKTIDRTESAKGRGTNKGQIEIKKDEEKGKEGQRVIEAENW